MMCGGMRCGGMMCGGFRCLVVLAVGEVGDGSSSKKFGYFVKGKCPCIVAGALLFWLIIIVPSSKYSMS